MSACRVGRKVRCLMAADTRPLTIFLMGPTASGKTALACALAERFPLDLVSVDSTLVYRGLNVGSAKPDAATLTRHPHRLIDVRDPRESYSVGEFRADAQREMTAITASGRVPLLVGGTGLYFRALQHGLSDLPMADPDLRLQLRSEAEILGLPTMHARLRTLDPVAAAQIRASDPQRLLRALEVIMLTGRPLSELQRKSGVRLPWRILKLALLPSERGGLHRRIAERFDAMLEAGFLNEVRKLRDRADLDATLPALRAVGYRQVWQHLDGEIDSLTLRDRAIYATRQLAKRQITWLRAERDAVVLDPDSAVMPVRATALVMAYLSTA